MNLKVIREKMLQIDWSVYLFHRLTQFDDLPMPIIQYLLYDMPLSY